MTNCHDMNAGPLPGGLNTVHENTLVTSTIGLWARMRDAYARRRERARKNWVRYTTELEISKLSPELRKDIGWPNRYED
jgi:hypothetical protein